MKLVDLKNINKKDIPLHYRNEFSGAAVFAYPPVTGKENVEKKIDFIIERTALGKLDISVHLRDDLDYPLLPVLKSLKSYIRDLHERGLLPRT